MEAMHLCLQRRGLSSVLPGFLSIRDDAVSLSWVGDCRPGFVRHARTTGDWLRSVEEEDVRAASALIYA